VAAGVCILIAASAEAAERVPQAPAAIFGKLYADVELAGIFPDSKTFADAVPRRPPAQILADYRPGLSKDDLRAFVARNFDLPAQVEPAPPTAARLPLAAHIAALWPVLARPPLAARPYSSQLSLNYPYVVPGGRFREVYYWDSYFTALGLMDDGRQDLARGLVNNFADLTRRYGHVPNGARTYYLSRSQPPVFFLMTGLLSSRDPAAGYARYLPALRQEYRYWMQGEDHVRAGHAIRNVVRLKDGSLLNRYWDASNTPRDESYREDVALAASSGRPAPALYLDIRAAAESGWDFSSRWLADGRSLASLETTAIVPVDLNSLLFGMERAIAEGCGRAREFTCRREFTARAERRRRAIDRYLWDNAHGEYLDFDWGTDHSLDRPSAAMLFPLFVGAASDQQAGQVAREVRSQLLGQGGLRTTTVRTGQQWDAPNGWAPLQWIAVEGLRRYGHAGLAREIAIRWIATVSRTYRETGKLLEKYDVDEIRPGGGGEYPLQDGFGWTNGVTRALLSAYPSRNDAPAGSSTAREAAAAATKQAPPSARAQMASPPRSVLSARPSTVAARSWGVTMVKLKMPM
jgi:alpha,alpha-trehalase